MDSPLSNNIHCPKEVFLLIAEKIGKKKLTICIAIPLVVGGISAWLTMNSMDTFERLNQPPLSPPGWLFPVVWTVLFVLMGIGSYLVVESEAAQAIKNQPYGPTVFSWHSTSCGRLCFSICNGSCLRSSGLWCCGC